MHLHLGNILCIFILIIDVSVVNYFIFCFVLVAAFGVIMNAFERVLIEIKTLVMWVIIQNICDTFLTYSNESTM